MEADMKSDDIFTGTKEEILVDIICRLEPNDWILVKGSRGMAMETIVEGLIEWANR